MKKPKPPHLEIRIFWRRRGAFQWRIVEDETGKTVEKGVCPAMDTARLEAASVLRELSDR